MAGLHTRLMFSLFIIIISITAGILMQGQATVIRENFTIAIFTGGLVIVLIVIISQHFLSGSKYDNSLH